MPTSTGTVEEWLARYLLVLSDIAGWEAWFSADGLTVTRYSSDLHAWTDLPTTDLQVLNLYVKQQRIHWRGNTPIKRGYTGKVGCIVFTGLDEYNLPERGLVTGTLLTDDRYNAIRDTSRTAYRARWEAQRGT